MPSASNFRSGRHVVFSLQVHLVFVPKYRRAVITERVFSVLHAAWEQVCRDFECELRETGWESDHVHLLVRYPPKVALSRLVNSLRRARVWTPGTGQHRLASSPPTRRVAVSPRCAVPLLAVVSVTPCRRAAATKRGLSGLHGAWRGVCRDFSGAPRETVWESDRVRVLGGVPPKVALSRLVN